MADLTRADELVRTMEQDTAFQAEVESSPTMAAKRAVLDDHGFQDVGFDDMKAYVESKGGTLTVQQGGRELSEQELAAVAGGMTGEEIGGVVGGSVFMVGVIGTMAAIAAAS